MKKKFLLPLLMMCVGSFVVATGCNDGKSSSTADPMSAEITLSQESVQLEAYQEFLLTAIYEGDETVVWTVADPTIVSVENGKLVALKAGTTTVTVTAGSVTDTCTVTVAPLDETRIYLQVAEANVSLSKNEQQQIETTIKYNGEVIDKVAEKSYESSDSNVVSVDENGKMTAKAFGRATISVSCTISGVEFGASVNVEVISSGSVEIEQSSVTLDMTDANNQATLTAKAYEKGVEKADATIVWSATDGQDVIELVNGTVTAMNAGETTVTATYVDNDGEVKTDTVTVVVEPITVSIENSIEVWKDEHVDGYPVDELGLDTAGTVIGGYVVLEGELTTTLPLADGKYDFSSISVGEMELYVQTRNITYQMVVTVANGIRLYNSNFAKYINVEGTITGDYLLMEDIDLGGTYYGDGNTFAGTLDGNGHKISGIYHTADGAYGGLFQYLQGTVKNVSVVGTLRRSGLIADTCNGAALIENVYLEATLSNKNEGAIARWCSKGADITMKNVVMIKNNTQEQSGAVFGFLVKDAKITMENCYYIGQNGVNPLATRGDTTYLNMNGNGDVTAFGEKSTNESITDYTVTTWTKEDKATLTAYTDETLADAKAAFDAAVAANSDMISAELKALMGYTTAN